MICCAFVFVTTTSSAQKHIYQNKYENKLTRFGFYLSAHNSHANVEYSDFFANNRDTTLSITSHKFFGFGVGFIVNFGFKQNKKVRIRLLPGVSFYTRDLLFKYNRGATSELNILSTLVEIPVMIKYKSDRRGNSRVYFIGGFVPGIEVGGKSTVAAGVRLGNSSTILRNFNVEISYGIGMDLYTRFVKLAPEIRISHGIKNLLTAEENSYSRNMSSLTSSKIAFIINFE